jgi:peroxiredoxin Q/BCP
MLKEGTQAPDFTVTDHNGNTVRLADYRGRRVVLWFYPKADTPGCTLEGQGFRDNYHRFKAKDTAVLGVSLDDEAANKAFAEKYAFPFPLLCDVDRKIALAYHAVTGPDDAYARRISYVIGEDGVIQESIEKVDTQTHSRDLCSRL